MREYDVRDLACPGPVLKLRELFDDGEREIRFHVADQLSRSNVTRFATSRGAGVAVEAESDGSFLLTITAASDSAGDRPGDRPSEAELLECNLPGATPSPVVVQIAGGTMGSGDDELGALLLRSFLKTVIELERKPEAIIFYNDGVKLCCADSVLLDDLRGLEAGGIEIIACGTCLNFFELSDRLEVGRVTDMLEIAGRLAAAGLIIRP